MNSMISWLQSFSSWLQSFFDKFSDFERITFAVSIILFLSFLGGWAINNFNKFE